MHDGVVELEVKVLNALVAVPVEGIWPEVARLADQPLGHEVDYELRGARLEATHPPFKVGVRDLVADYRQQIARVGSDTPKHRAQDWARRSM
jgi:hypothetical protein